MIFKLFATCFNIYLVYIVIHVLKEIDCKDVFAHVERPVVSYVNPKYFAFFNMTSRRLNRRTPYYLEIHANMLKQLDNATFIHLHYYELLTNQYKRTFVEFHMRMCDFHNEDIVIGTPMVRALTKMLKAMPPAERPTNSTKCPIPPGIYHLSEFAPPQSSLYKSFPFQKGRVAINVTMHKELAIMLQLDLEIKNKI